MVLVLVLAGCDQAPRTSQATVAAEPAAPSLPAPVLDELDDAGLRARAQEAVRAQRIHSPAGDSAVDYYLALRERSPDASVAAALTELQPYVLIAAEQALAREDLDETRRLLGLLSRMDATAPALPRLREGLRVAQQRADRAEGAREPEPARRPDTQAAPVRIATAAPVAPKPANPTASAPPPATPAPEPKMESALAAPPSPVARETVAPPLPRLIADAVPRYPQSARNRRIEGSVQVIFTIEPDGSVSDARPVSAQPAGVFEDAALAAVARWRFEATGRSVRTTRTLNFRLPADAKG